MSVLSVNLASTNASQAQFQAWASGIATKIAALGLVQTADTGQINLGTVAAPTASNQSMGYQVFRFADALQGTAPVFLKIEYGAGSSAASYAGLWLTIGTGSDGAGNLTGQVGTRIQVAGGSSATAYLCIFTGNAGRLTMGLFLNSTVAMVINVERSKDAAGADSGDGVFIQAGSKGTNTYFQQFIPMAGAIKAAQTIASAAIPAGVTSMAYGADVHMAAVNPVAMEGLKNPTAGLLAYFEADFPAGVAAPVQVHGATRTYYPIGTTIYGTAVSGFATSTWAILYE